MCNVFIFLILPTGIDKTTLLVLCFWVPTPVWCFVFPSLLFLVALVFGFVHGLGVVLGRGIDGVKDLRVVLSACLFALLWI